MGIQLGGLWERSGLKANKRKVGEDGAVGTRVTCNRQAGRLGQQDLGATTYSLYNRHQFKEINHWDGVGGASRRVKSQGRLLLAGMRSWSFGADAPNGWAARVYTETPALRSSQYPDLLGLAWCLAKPLQQLWTNRTTCL